MVIASCRTPVTGFGSALRKGFERRAISVHALQATEIASVANELLRAAREKARDRNFRIGECVLMHPSAPAKPPLEDFDAFEGDDRAHVVWVSAAAQDQAPLTELIQRLDQATQGKR